SATSSMVTRLRWAAEKSFTVMDLIIGVVAVLYIKHLKPVSGNTIGTVAVNRIVPSDRLDT
ncbi:hypothetical protein, partial [Pseudomonas sp.]|uniref:hypothetical protein n=1 Tax=Pseudomonas sp. TaxID=306 RepID=UPI00326474A0